MKKIRIGTRGSKLALKQASLVRDALSEAGYGTEIVTIHTKGDRIQDKPLWQIGDKGVFASELEEALKDGEIDLAVHSAKDLPMELEKGLVIAAVLKRADVRVVLGCAGRPGRRGGCAGNREPGAYFGSGQAAGGGRRWRGSYGKTWYARISAAMWTPACES